jgi:DNA-binding transcriptional LysR family regulator
MKLSLQTLETFFWVVRLGSFSRAAQRLHLSQPAISMRIRQLESELGVVLLERSTSALRVTVAGRKCFEHAERMLSLCAELHHQTTDASALAGTVRMGVTEAIAVTWLPRLISQLSRRYPKIVPELDIDVNTSLNNKFANGELDCLLMPGPIPFRDVVAEYIGELTFRWVACPALVGSKRELTPKELGKLCVVTLSRETNLYELIHDWFVVNHVQPRRYCFCNSVSTMIALAKSGMGVALLPERAIREDIAQQSLVLLRARKPLVRLRYFCVHPTHSANAAANVIPFLAKETSSFVFNKN